MLRWIKFKAGRPKGEIQLSMLKPKTPISHTSNTTSTTNIEQIFKSNTVIPEVQSDDKSIPKTEIPPPSPKNNVILFQAPAAIHQKVFVVIDMQYYFEAAKNPVLIAELKAALRQAMRDGNYILFVNYDLGDRLDPDQVLIPELSKLSESYTHKNTILKKQDSGAREILDHLASKKMYVSKMSISGVNSCACVYETVRDLSKMNKNPFLIEIKESCCFCDSDDTACTHQSILKLEDCRNVISDKHQNSLRAVLFKGDYPHLKSIVDQYIADIENRKVARQQLLQIKGDLLLTLYHIEQTSPKPPITTSLSLKIKPLLDNIQKQLDEPIMDNEPVETRRYAIS